MINHVFFRTRQNRYLQRVGEKKKKAVESKWYLLVCNA
jgi:hypothetical protein